MLTTMTYQSHVNLKEEPFSPSTSDFSSCSGSGVYSVAHSRTDSSSSMDQYEASVYADGPLAKRIKCEIEEPPASQPETKNKLKNVVMDRRKARGITDVPSNLFEKPKEFELTEADRERREKRKDQNRKAAKRCREKKKELQDKVAQETMNVTQSNEKLQETTRLLLQMVKELRACLLEHLECGDCRLSTIAQEQHKQQLHHLANLLQCVTNIQLQQEMCLHQPRATEIPDNIQDDTCVLGHQSRSEDSGSVSNCDMLFVAEPDNNVSLTDYVNPSTIVTNFEDNLHSWDLANINPDIPNTGLDPSFPQIGLDDAVNNTDMVDQPLLPVDGAQFDYMQTSIKPSYGRDLTHDFSNPYPATTGDCGLYAAQTSSSSYMKNDTHFPTSSQLTNLGQSTPIADKYTGSPNIYTCVSPNLIQPNIAAYQSASSFSTAESILNYSHSISGGSLMSQQCQSDVNNNGEGQSGTNKSQGNNGCCATTPPRVDILPLNYLDRLENIDSLTRNYFTFDCNDPSPKSVGVSGTEPISPFYTQGGNARL